VVPKAAFFVVLIWEILNGEEMRVLCELIKPER
jgi:hypothetical protein